MRGISSAKPSRTDRLPRIQARPELETLPMAPREFSPNSAWEITPERAKDLEENYRRAAPRFQDRNGKVRNQWHRKSIGEMANELGRRAQYKMPYAYAASIHHSNPKGLLAYADIQEGKPI